MSSAHKRKSNAIMRILRGHNASLPACQQRFRNRNP
jgi:hypothetical protein